jgi:YrbI family 3-deoxy-D-manno-octulosonate 8-phosphate phosphatase
MKKTKNFSNSKNIKLVLTDVDGVLTDGSRYYNEKKEIMKKFHVRDGMGVNLLLRNNIKTAIVTKEKSLIVKKWAKEMNVFDVYSGVLKKELILEKICKKFNLSKKNIAFIGDDVNDLELMELVGFSATPSDGIESAKKIANYVCISNGGRGAFREFVDLILKNQFPNKTKWY